MRTGITSFFPPSLEIKETCADFSSSLNFNIVSKGLGSQKMSHYLNEAAGDMRDLLMPTVEAPKAKL